MYAFEIEVEGLVQRAVPLAREVSRFPTILRDISIVVPQDVRYAAIEQTIRQAIGPLVRDVFIFDRYVGANLGTDVKSLSMGLILQDHSRTLTDQDADRCVALAVSALEAGCKAKLRG